MKKQDQMHSKLVSKLSFLFLLKYRQSEIWYCLKFYKLGSLASFLKILNKEEGAVKWIKTIKKDYKEEIKVQVIINCSFFQARRKS